jgi:hypothetical protein
LAAAEKEGWNLINRPRAAAAATRDAKMANMKPAGLDFSP